MIAPERLEQEVEAVAEAMASVIRSTPEYASQMLVVGYHIIVECLIHPNNTEAIAALREVTGLYTAHGELDHDDVMNALRADALAALEFLGLTPLPHDCDETEGLNAADPIRDHIKEQVRPDIERILTERLEAVPIPGKPN